jgi:hypothetical protein
MKHRSRCTSPVCVVLVLLLASRVGAAPWEAQVGDLGHNVHRFAIHIGASYGGLSGSEVPKTEAGPGFEAGLSYRVLGSLSVYGGYAWHTSDVNGQITQLLDVYVRGDTRSGNVSGNVKSQRFRGAVRVDAYRVEDWKFQVYAIAGGLYSLVDATIDTVDGKPPESYFVPVEGGGFVEIDPGTISDNNWGVFGRVGLEYFLGERFAADGSFSFEVLDAPPGTKDLSTFTVGVTYRI